MPYICCVPNCKGNYRNGPKVSVYNFPKDPILRKRWINAVHRKDFEHSESSKVCMLHFEPSQIVREASAYDPRTGRTLTAPLKIPRLREGAVPTLLMPPPGSLVKTRRGWKNNQPKEVEVKEGPDENELTKLLQTELGVEFQNVVETPFEVKEEPDESVDETPRLIIENVISAKNALSLSSFSSSSSSTSFSSSTSSSSSSSSVNSSSPRGISPAVENVLAFAYPDSTNMQEIPATQVSSMPTQQRKISDAEPDTVDTTSDGAQAKLSRPTTLTMPSKLHPSVVTLKKSTEVTLKGHQVQKRKLNDEEPDVNDASPDATRTQTKLSSHTKPSVSSNRKRKLDLPTGTSKKPAGHSTLPTMNSENETRNIFQSLVGGSESNPLFGSRTRERPSDLFDVFANFIGDKLREMEFDDCAYALRAILDIVFKAGKVQRDYEVHSDISIPNASPEYSDQE